MRSFSSSNLLAIAGMLLTGVATGMETFHLFTDKVGFQVQNHDMCKRPCVTNVLTFYECRHFSKTDPCDTAVCLNDKAYYVECENSASETDAERCLTEFDATAIRREQVKTRPYNGYGPIDCGSDDNEYHLVPGGPPSVDFYPCKFYHMVPVGKCFINWFGNCDGVIMDGNIPNGLGRQVCR